MFLELHKAENNEKIMLNIDKIQSICQRKGETYIFIGLSTFKIKESYEDIAKCLDKYYEYRKRGREMTDVERENHIRIANMLIGFINELQAPILKYQIEKDVTKEALENYIKMLEQTEQEEAEEKQEEKKAESIEDKTWSNFNAILSIYSYYEKALEDITKEPIPPCFNSICDPKYLKFALDGLEDAMAALTMLYKNILERSGTHGE